MPLQRTEELNEMEAICARLGIERGLHIRSKFKNENLNCYGFANHVETYRAVFDLVVNYSNTERVAKINNFSNGQLRDIKSKIYSTGKTGINSEMRSGIIEKCAKLKKNYDKKSQTDFTEMDKILEQQRIERINQAPINDENAPLKRKKRKKRKNRVKRVDPEVEQGIIHKIEIDETKKINTLLDNLRAQLLGTVMNKPNGYNPRL